jgi:pimeloyl-ACP methyl ester carboxylesterase
MTTEETPVILIHGAGLDSRLWPVSLKRLPDCWTFSIDLPGHGYSTAVCRHSVSEYAQAVMNFLIQLKLSGVLVIGHGLGGAIGLSAAGQVPDLVSGVILINTAANLKIPQSAIMKASRGEIIEAFHLLISRGLPQPEKKNRVNLLKNIIEAQRNSVLQADFRLLQQDQTVSLDIPVSIPVDQVLGRENPFIGRMHGPDDLPHFWSRVWVPGGGHWLPLENPSFIKKWIIDFMSRINRQF